MAKKILYYDTTLRDGSQAEGVSFTLEDKLRITEELDRLGINYAEGGWPGSNEKDIEYFKNARNLKLKNLKISAFGSTRYHKYKASEDPNLVALIESKTPVVCIFGKTWDFHVKEALKISLDKNLEMIGDSVRYLKSKNREVIYDAEHFFDGYKNNPEYAIKTLEAAASAGADNISLCDTNGGTLTFDLEEMIREVTRRISGIPLGIHAHNDNGLGVANSIYAVKMGITLVQGTINGFGERCGNADLCSIIPNIELKMNLRNLRKDQLAMLTGVSRYVSELANLPHNEKLPYVGNSAFAHKGGIHVSAILKNTATYEHLKPELVGNRRRVIVSELSGKSNIVYKAKELGVKIDNVEGVSKDVVKEIKRLENEGFQFEGAEGSFELLIKKSSGKYKPLFNLHSYRLIVEKEKDGDIISEATIKFESNNKIYHTVAEGNGPVNALDRALRKSLEVLYPKIKELSLFDYKVRVLGGKEGTAARVRVLIESRAKHSTWGTVGVSENIIEASWNALVDSIEYYVFKIMKLIK
ncbi:MAG: citramalate synthase [Spirochaetes bacterium]|nr:citramalate synthase [Spirochaetota bacterium]